MFLLGVTERAFRAFCFSFGKKKNKFTGQFALVCGLVLALCCTSVFAQTSLDWEDQGFPSDSSFPSGFVFDDGSTQATFSWELVQDGGVTLPGLADFVTYNDGSLGGAGGNVIFVMDNNTVDLDDRIVFEATFSQAVTNLQFNVLEIDSNATSDEAVEVFFDNGVDGFQNIADFPAFATEGGTNIARDNIAGVNGWEGDGTGSGTNADLVVDFGAQEVVAVRIEFFTGDDAPANPSFLLSGVGDLSWELPPPSANEADLSLNLMPALTSPVIGSNTFFDITLANAGGLDASGVVVDLPLPAGLVYQSDNTGGAYNPATGQWNVPGIVTAGSTATMRVIVEVGAAGPYTVIGEVASSSEPDPDSTPGNASTMPLEDDTGTFTLAPIEPPAQLFCLGRPITPLVFENPVLESGSSLQLNSVYRFTSVAPGADALVEVVAFNGGAGLLTIDNPVDGLFDNFQPTLSGPAGDVSVDFAITIVATGTNTPIVLDFAGSAIDVDGNGVGNGLREYIEVSDNIVEFALNDPSELDLNASGPSAFDRVRFEARTDVNATGISIDAPEHIVTAFFTDVSVFEYRIGKFGVAAGGAGRLNSLAFNCPNLTTPAPNPSADEDFGDAPASYGNPIHTIEAGIQLGAINSADSGPFDSPDASGDSGDDGVTIPTLSVGSPAVFSVTATGAGGHLQVWFDWNNNGNFDDAGEQVATDMMDTDANGVVDLSFVVPSSAVPGNSFARFRWSTVTGLSPIEAAGNGEIEDYAVTILAGTPAIEGVKTVSIFEPDGLSGFALPGNDVVYTIAVSNSGTLPIDSGSVFLVDQLPPEVTFFFGDVDGSGPETEPVAFLEIVDTDLNPFVFDDDVGFSDALTPPSNFSDCLYEPTAGYDPAIRHVCFNPKGVLQAGDPDPAFSVSFRARIK